MKSRRISLADPTGNSACDNVSRRSAGPQRPGTVRADWGVETVASERVTDGPSSCLLNRPRRAYFDHPDYGRKVPGQAEGPKAANPGAFTTPTPLRGANGCNTDGD